MRIEIGTIRGHLGTHGLHELVACPDKGAWVGGVVQLLGLPGPWPNLWVLPGIASGVECCHGHAVYLNVVRMTITALLVIAGHNVRADAPDQAYQTPGSLLEVSLGQAVRMVIRFPPHHARVTIAEDMQFFDP